MDVSILFPNRERTKKTCRGAPPHKYILAPSFEELVRSAYTVLLTDTHAHGNTNLFFFLIQDNGVFGYMLLTEDKDNPITTACNSYRSLQYVYDDMKYNIRWSKSLEELIKDLTPSLKSPRSIPVDNFLLKIIEFNLHHSLPNPINIVSK